MWCPDYIYLLLSVRVKWPTLFFAAEQVINASKKKKFNYEFATTWLSIWQIIVHSEIGTDAIRCYNRKEGAGLLNFLWTIKSTIFSNLFSPRRVIAVVKRLFISPIEHGMYGKFRASTFHGNFIAVTMWTRSPIDEPDTNIFHLGNQLQAARCNSD